MDRALGTEVSPLRLMVSGAPFEEVVEAIERSFDPDDPRGADLKDAAAELHRVRESERRRLRDTGLLAESALDLAELKDLDEVLEAICLRARRLLETDVAYITLIDSERGDTFVRATHGVVAEEFRCMRIPMGIGLGGLVAAERSQAYTSDYHDDERFSHTAELDFCVAAEGLRAIAGVPLRRRQNVIGVLMSGSRSVRQFEPSELAPFESLANHAAVAIENARLFARARESLLELETEQAAGRRVALFQERLATLAIEGSPANELTAAAAEEVGGRLTLVERYARGDPEPPAEGAIVVEVATGPDHIGDLVWEPPEEDTEAGAELLRRAADIIARQLLNQAAIGEASLRRRSDLADTIFDEEEDDLDALRHEASMLGLDLDQPFVVLVAEFQGGVSRWLSLRSLRAAVDEDGIARAHRGLIGIAVPGTEPDAVAARWENILRQRGTRPNLGVTPASPGIESLHKAHADAVSSLGFLRSLGRCGVTVRADQLGLMTLLFAGGRSGDVEAFVQQILGPLIERDEQSRKANLIATLEAYFRSGGHPSAAARGLGIHVNTLYQRLERISDLIGDDWRSPDRGLELQLALRAAALSRPSGDD